MQFEAVLCKQTFGKTLIELKLYQVVSCSGQGLREADPGSTVQPLGQEDRRSSGPRWRHETVLIPEAFFHVVDFGLLW